MVQEARRSVVQVVTSRGTGSGFIADYRGYVLTNAHVVLDEAQVTVRFDDGLSEQADVVYHDDYRDMALLKVAIGRSRPALHIASTVRQGESVVALGFPFESVLGGNLTITTGVVSSFRRYDGVDYLQTDAALNPGNSGGPLLNIHGEVVGMNTSGLTDAQNINFAIRHNVLAQWLPYMVREARALPTPTPTRPAKTTPTPALGQVGPYDVSLEHNADDGNVKTEWLGVSFANVDVSATFHNPHDSLLRTWDYGFWIRDNRPARKLFLTFVVVCDAECSLEVGSRGTDPEAGQDIDSIWARNLTIGAQQWNRFRVVAEGDSSEVFINGNSVGTFRLDGLTHAGDVAVTTGNYSGHELDGSVTEVTDIVAMDLDVAGLR